MSAAVRLRRDDIRRTEDSRHTANASAVLQAAADHGPVARSTIARLGGLSPAAVSRLCADLTAAGTQVITLLALSDDGASSHDRDNAAALAGLGVTAFACTPDAFPDLMAAAIERRDITQWAAKYQAAETNGS